MRYTPKAQEYVDSVDGEVHQSAVKIITKLEAENETLLLTAEIFKTESEIKDIMKIENKALKDRDELRASLLVKFQDENKILKQSMDKLLGELKEVESTGYLPDGNEVNLSTEMWLERLIQKTEKESK